MFEAAFGCRLVNGSGRSGERRCSIPHWAGLGSFAPVGVGGRKPTGADRAEHSCFDIRRGWRGVIRGERSQPTLTGSVRTQTVDAGSRPRSVATGVAGLLRWRNAH